MRGGAAGNLLDRGLYSYVRDFLDVEIGSYHWPTFNVADSFICVAAVTMCVLYLFTAEKTSHATEKKII